MGESRQLTVYVWSVARVLQLECDWKAGLWLAKKDLQKKFDTLNRDTFPKRLESKIGPGLLDDVCNRHGWDRESHGLVGQMVGEVAFVGDIITWHGGSKEEKFAACGAKVERRRMPGLPQPVVHGCWPHTAGRCPDAGERHVNVMGYELRVRIEAILPMFARGKNEFWARKHFFISNACLAGRLRLLHTVVGNSIRWSAGAFQPDVGVMHAINTLQTHFVVWCLTWDWGKTGWSTGREHGGLPEMPFTRSCERWRATWLRRSWAYSGHRAGLGSWDNPPVSGVLDSFRDGEWWRRQHRSKDEFRHPTRFYSQLRAAGGPMAGVKPGTRSVGDRHVFDAVTGTLSVGTWKGMPVCTRTTLP